MELAELVQDPGFRARPVLDELLGPDADRAAVLSRLEAGFHAQANRYRQLIALAALRSRADG